jgi:hypothetical protein
MNTSKRVGLVFLILVSLAFVIGFAISSSSRAANSGVRQSLVALYRGDMGFWLMGDSNTTPESDWSFTDAEQTVLVETRTPYLVRHFVRTFIARRGAELYLFSEYFAPLRGQTDLRDHFPEARFWNRMVVRDPRIRVKIGNKVFKMRAYSITDESAKQAARQAFFSKYPDLKKQDALPESQRPTLYFFHLTSGWDDQS